MELANQPFAGADPTALEFAQPTFALPSDPVSAEFVTTCPATRPFNEGYLEKNLDRLESIPAAGEISAGMVEYLLLLLRSGAKSSTEVRAALNEEVTDKDNMLRESQRNYYEAAKSAREVCYSLVTCYEMKQGDVQLLLVDKQFGKKTSSSNEAFRDALEEKWDQLDLDANSAPSHIAYHGKLPTSYLPELAGILHGVQAQGFYALPAMHSAKEIKAWLKDNKLATPGDPKAAYLAALCTYAHLEGVTVDGTPDGKPLRINAAPMLAARMAQLRVGARPFGLQGAGLPIEGTNTKFRREMTAITELGDLGVCSLLKNGVLAGGVTTADTGVPDYSNLVAMGINVSIGRVLSKFCRDHLYADYDETTEAKHKQTLLTFLGKLKPVLRKAVSINDINLTYDPASQQVHVFLKIHFKGMTRRFTVCVDPNPTLEE